MRSRILRVARPISLAAAAAALLSPGLLLGPGFDASVYTLAGHRIVQGAMPYTGLFDNKPPGLYVVNAVGQILMPWLDPWTVAWILTLTFTAAAICILDALLRMTLSAVTAYVLSLACLVGVACHAVALGGGLTESFAFLPAIAALWVVVTRPPSTRMAVLVGLLAGAAALISIQAVPAAAVLLVAVVAAGGPARDRGKRLVASVCGAAALPLAVVAWLYAGGALGAAFEDNVTYNFYYRNTTAGILFLVPAVVLLTAGLVVPLTVAVVRMIRAPRSIDRIVWISGAWSLLFTAFIVVEDRIFLHYLIVLIPAVVIVSAPGIQWLLDAVRDPERGRRYAGIVLVFATFATCTVSAMGVVGLTQSTVDAVSKGHPGTASTGDWIRANTPASATLFLWGNDTDVYLTSERSPYDRYVYQFPWVTEGYWSEAKTAVLLAEWEASSPAVIVETDATVPLFRSKEAQDNPNSYDTVQPLRDWVSGHYRLSASFPSHDVYVYVPGS